MLRRIDAVVPAHDEEELIGACIDALLVAHAAVRRSRPELDVGITIVLDDCRDGSERVVAERIAAAKTRTGAGGRGGRDAVVVSIVTIEERSVGAARRVGVEAALAGSPFGLDERWIASTDADSRVPSDWFEIHAAAWDAGRDVLLGTVRPDFDEFSERDVQHWLTTHPAGQLPGNVHGANLGIRADRLQELGGFNALPEHEDVDLVQRARAAGLLVVPTLDGVVATSGRRHGRTPAGYAAFLAKEYPVTAHLGCAAVGREPVG
ncbi:MAG TPA: glycosyltransferase [Plantibacter sp.]|uniref:glycosyltransferase n=1 Tax=unclassified Plantibacter TaxID=2624265 RepID=UPI002CAEE62F|nr:glycosyltransferase [Plantibacter sp.]